MPEVTVLLTNREAHIRDADTRTYEKLNEAWSFFVPSAFHVPAYKLWLREKARAIKEGEPDRRVEGWDGRIRFIRRRALSAGLFRATRAEVGEKTGVQFNVVRTLPKVPAFLPGLPPSPDPKYAFQDECADAMCIALKRGGGIILNATGSGKTATTARFFSRLPQVCLFIVDEIDLMMQAQRELTQWLREPIGIVGNSKYEPRQKTVATIQTLHRHRNDPAFLRWFHSVEVMVIDELHAQLAKRNAKVLETISPVACYGLTATLQLKKKDVRLRAHALTGPMIYEYPLIQGVEDKVLTKGRCIQFLFEEIGEGSVGGRAGYQLEYSTEVVENELKGRAVAAIVKLLVDEGKYVIPLVERIAHIKVLKGLFKSKGISFRTAYGAKTTDQRKKSRESMEDGRTHVIIANRVFKKGTNIKRVDVLIDAAEMYDKNDACQKYGRGVRLHEDKEELLYIDIGTQSGRFHRAAKSRAKALRSIGIDVETIKVSSVKEVLKVLKGVLNG